MDMESVAVLTGESARGQPVTAGDKSSGGACGASAWRLAPWGSSGRSREKRCDKKEPGETGSRVEQAASGLQPSSALRLMRQGQVLGPPPPTRPRPGPPTALWTGASRSESSKIHTGLRTVFPTPLSRPLANLAGAEYFILSRMFLHVLPRFPLSRKPSAPLCWWKYPSLSRSTTPFLTPSGPARFL